jgi:hypothetical protein
MQPLAVPAIEIDKMSVVEGKSVQRRVDLDGRNIVRKKKDNATILKLFMVQISFSAQIVPSSHF